MRIASTVLLALISCAASGAELVVHEWGTITTVHAADGTPQGGLNQIDESEVLPKFVHRYEPEVTRFDPKLRLAKVPLIPGRPDVTMRLETPVIYFHPPAGKKFDAPIDVEVSFRGGVLNEFYPDAEPGVSLDLARIQEKRAEGVLDKPWTGEVLNNFVRGKLVWRGVRLHDTVVAPLTNDPVWLAPREVQAASVFVPEVGEGERYLFYRGVGAMSALLQTRTSDSQVRISAPEHLVWLDTELAQLRRVWLVEVRADQSLAFRDHGPVQLRKDAAGQELGRLKRFGNDEFSPQNLKLLWASLKSALIRDGLFADEAEAMLNTWKASYFGKPGLRVLYIVPRAWTEHVLPLSFSVPARVNRVIVGRIDLLE